jgi:hypothetical protein
VASFVLEMVPLVSLVFTYTNTAGAALWAADIESKSSTAPGLRDRAKKVE